METSHPMMSSLPLRLMFWFFSWPLGNLIFALLTGLKPWYHLNEESEIQRAMIEKGGPYIDPRFRNRSFIERRLVEIMDKCHTLKPHKRPNIFEVVEHLRETKHIYESTRGKDDSLLQESEAKTVAAKQED